MLGAFKRSLSQSEQLLLQVVQTLWGILLFNHLVELLLEIEHVEEIVLSLVIETVEFLVDGLTELPLLLAFRRLNRFNLDRQLKR